MCDPPGKEYRPQRDSNRYPRALSSPRYEWAILYLDNSHWHYNAPPFRVPSKIQNYYIFVRVRTQDAYITGEAVRRFTHCATSPSLARTTSEWVLTDEQPVYTSWISILVACFQLLNGFTSCSLYLIINSLYIWPTNKLNKMNSRSV